MNVLDEIQTAARLPSLTLGPAQRNRLAQLCVQRTPVVWDATCAAPPGGAVIVLDPASTARMEALVGSLDPDAIVIIPFGEHPAFDGLKAKLAIHGSIGAEGAAAPHHLWWGGVKPLSARTGMYSKAGTLLLSSYRNGSVPERQLMRFRGYIDLNGLDCVIERSPNEPRARGTHKIDFILRQLQAGDRPVFWIDTGAEIRRHPVLPQSLGCDFAVHRKRGGELDTAAMFFRPTEPARALLQAWRDLSLGYPDLPEHFLLDQAWILTAAQRQIETAWLPEDYCQTDPALRDGATIVIDHTRFERSAAQLPTRHLLAARRFGRQQAPEPHLIMKGMDGARGAITVVVRDVLGRDASQVGGAVEAISRAFAADCGGFSKLELVLCGWADDVHAVMQIEDNGWVLVTDPAERLRPDAFKAPDRHRLTMRCSERGQPLWEAPAIAPA
ncbi:hypothetical protein [Rhodopseudomonas palustris]|uniref:Uncharacterized protein n=1 Tax=Rhodopseudomonas palustris (strain BisB18) TaxID=316056 RepID=Q21B03_RHOPB